MKIIGAFLFFVFVFVLPSQAEEADTIHQIVEDYKKAEMLLKSGGINQATHHELLINLQARAEYQMLKQSYEDRKRYGTLQPWETLEKQKYYYEAPICPTEECHIFYKIWSGYKVQTN